MNEQMWMSVPDDSRTADSFDRLREKWKTFLTGGSSSTTDTLDPDIAKVIRNITERANVSWSSLSQEFEHSNYLWKDLNDWTKSSTPGTCFKRIKDMALAYATQGTTMEDHPDLRNAILNALDWLYANAYNENTSPYDNWWWWQIGIPKDLADICVLMYNHLSAEKMNSYMKAVKHFTPIATGTTPYDTGANRVDKAQAVMIRGILEKDSHAIANARDALNDVFSYVSSGEGFYRDGSFIQHKNIPYTLSYGTVLLQGMAWIIAQLDGSNWAVQHSKMENLYKWVCDSFQPFIYKGAGMDMVRGRAISRPRMQDHDAGHLAIQAITMISQFAPTEQAACFKGMVKGWLTQDHYMSPYDGLNIYLIKLTKEILDDPEIKSVPELVVHKQYSNMDRVVHLRPGFGFGLSMFSNRIQSYEIMNGENFHGWFTASGMTYLYNDDLSQYSENYWATINPYRLPGTTVENKPMQDGVPYKYTSNQSWVGGASLEDLYGIAGMQLEQYDSDLIAKKSWFFFDDKIVTLGSGITSSGHHAVETTIENLKLNKKGDNLFTVNGVRQSSSLGWSKKLENVQWMNIQGNTQTGSNVGVYFPTPAIVHALRESRSGTWSSINSWETNKQVENQFLTLWLNHGENPVNATYAYVILPNKSDEEVEAYFNHPDVEILENSTEAHAISDNKLKIIGVNFWEDKTKTVGWITCNKKASVIVHESSNGELIIAVSDPTMANSGIIDIEVNKTAAAIRSADPEITVSHLSPKIKLSVSVEGSSGRTISAKFNL